MMAWMRRGQIQYRARPSSSSMAVSLSLRAAAAGSFALDGPSRSVGETGSLVLRWARRLMEWVHLLRYRRRQQHEACFPDGACLGETASSSWNKVLQTSLSFVSVCSGAGVGSVRSYTGVVVACWSSCCRCLSRVEPQGYCDVPVVYRVFR